MGDRIKELRLAAGLSQTRLARKAGVPLSTYLSWEWGQRTMLLDSAVKLADALDCSLDAIAGRKWPKGKKGGAS
jgi:transcriptional regulator with XRE-family HTH domain